MVLCKNAETVSEERQSKKFMGCAHLHCREKNPDHIVHSKCCNTELLIAQASTIMVAHRCHSFFYTKFYFTSYMNVSIKKVKEKAHHARTWKSSTIGESEERDED